MTLVLLRDRDHETEVRVDHEILRFLVASLEALGEFHLLGGGQQLVAACLVEEELERIGRGDGEVAVHVRAPDGVRAGAVVGEHDALLFELLEEAGRLIVVEVGLLEELADRGKVEATELLSLFQQSLQAFVYDHFAGLPCLDSGLTRILHFCSKDVTRAS